MFITKVIKRNKKAKVQNHEVDKFKIKRKISLINSFVQWKVDKEIQNISFFKMFFFLELFASNSILISRKISKIQPIRVSFA